MGTWNELDVEINVTVDTSDIDQLLSNISSDDLEIANLFAPAVDILSGLKKGVEEGSKTGAEEVADRTRSLQELTIALNGSIHTGKLIQSIKAEKQDDYHYLVGTTIEHFYPLTIEKGRGEVRPVNCPYLVFMFNGHLIRTKYSRPTTPRPYVEPSYQQVMGEANDIVWRNIENATK